MYPRALGIHHQSSCFRLPQSTTPYLSSPHPPKISIGQGPEAGLNELGNSKQRFVITGPEVATSYLARPRSWNIRFIGSLADNESLFGSPTILRAPNYIKKGPGRAGSQGRGFMNSELVSVAAGAGPMLIFLPGDAVLFRGSDFGEINGYHFIAVLRQEVSFFSPRWFLVPGTSGKGEFNKRGSKGIEAWKAARRGCC